MLKYFAQSCGHINVVKLCSMFTNEVTELFRVNYSHNLVVELNVESLAGPLRSCVLFRVKLLVSIPAFSFLPSASYLDGPVLALAITISAWYSTMSPSLSTLPSVMELMWQKTSSPPSVGLMNPNPRGFHLAASPLRRLLLLIFMFLLKSLPAFPPPRPKPIDSNLLLAAPNKNLLFAARSARHAHPLNAMTTPRKTPTPPK
jgi:hypothetical protein